MNQKKECIGQLGIDPPDLNCHHGSKQKAFLLAKAGGVALASPNCSFSNKQPQGVYLTCAAFVPGEYSYVCENMPKDLRFKIKEALVNTSTLITSAALPANNVKH